MGMRDKEAEKKALLPLYWMNKPVRAARIAMKLIWKIRKPKMKIAVWFEKILPRTEAGVQNRVFLQRRYANR